MKLLHNEIWDFIHRAPPSFEFDGARIINHSHARHLWLSDMASGSIHDRINRRSNMDLFIAPEYAPWRGSARTAIRRHERRKLAIAGMREFCHIHNL